MSCSEHLLPCQLVTFQTVSTPVSGLSFNKTMCPFSPISIEYMRTTWIRPPCGVIGLGSVEWSIHTATLTDQPGSNRIEGWHLKLTVSHPLAPRGVCRRGYAGALPQEKRSRAPRALRPGLLAHTLNPCSWKSMK